MEQLENPCSAMKDPVSHNKDLMQTKRKKENYPVGRAVSQTVLNGVGTGSLRSECWVQVPALPLRS